ncbi:unnamed protein product [Bursaphelenchus xylophilus]|uniref:(pine wood nematode) hypothetical protein n=1 Tax=Bursaphelenchus xylophilus TaxID=6326 RepID=A0A811LWN4_BURXY|nr:unnamed protein product [Bursaphelenchus xylophilus]CAG9125927.1 unnamed protein product [Bursaphelenchus xylophilus]
MMMIIAFCMIALNNTVRTLFELLATGVLIEWCAASCGVMLSTMFPSYTVAMSVAGPMLTVLSLVGGIYANVGELPVWISWMQYISWFKYGFEAFAIIEWTEMETDGCVIPVQHLESTTTTISNRSATEACFGADQILDLYSLKRSNLALDVGVMLGFITVFSVIGLLALFIRLKLSR